MVVGKVSEFIGSLYYLCVTLLRFKNIMKLKNYLLLLALLLAVVIQITPAIFLIINVVACFKQF